jgi:uncharacterized membrane protein
MEINGLPLHPLVVHAAVVFGPLAAIAAQAYVVLPAWRDRLRWPMLVLALMGTGAIAAAYVSGMNFFNSRPPELQQLDLLQTHRTRAIRLFWVTLGFGVLAVLAAWLHNRTGAVRVVLNVLLGLAALAVLALAVLAGDSGSRAVWEGSV